MRRLIAILGLAALVACGTPVAAIPTVAPTATPDRGAELARQLDEYAAWERGPQTLPRAAFLAQRPLLNGYVIYWQSHLRGFFRDTLANNYTVAQLREDPQLIADYLAGR